MALILTLQLDPESAQFFTTLRSRYFPPAINFLSAHVTLYHNLPDSEQPSIEARLAEVAQATFHLPLHVTGLRSLGRGVAYVLQSDPALALHSRLADEWRPWLTPQDRQKFNPHITVQNKVQPEEAARTRAELQASFGRQTIWGTGLQLWRYAGGPWDALATFSFSQNPDR